MNNTNFRAGVRPAPKIESPTGQGEAFEKRTGLESCCDDITVFTNWATYAAQHFLRHKRVGWRWPVEVAE